MIDACLSYVSRIVVQCIDWLDDLIGPFFNIIAPVLTMVMITRFILLPIFGGSTIVLGSDFVKQSKRKNNSSQSEE